MPDTGFLCERLFQPAKIYMIQILDIFACETFGKTNWTPLFIVYALASGDHICPVNASFDADFGLAEHLNRGAGDWNVNCHAYVISFLDPQQAASAGGRLCCVYVPFFSVDGCRDCCDYLAVPLASEWLLFPGSLQLS